MEEDIYQHLKELEEQHVRAVRGLEKLAKALKHVHEARTELSYLSEEANLNSTLSDLPEQLKLLKDALEDARLHNRRRVRAGLSAQALARTGETLLVAFTLYRKPRSALMHPSPLR